MKFTNEQVKARLIANKISPEFGSSPTQRLMFSVVEQALFDAVELEPKKGDGSEADKWDVDNWRASVVSAKRYLSAYMPHCEAVGVSSGWVIGVISKVNDCDIRQVGSDCGNFIIYRLMGESSDGEQLVLSSVNGNSGSTTLKKYNH